MRLARARIEREQRLRCGARVLARGVVGRARDQELRPRREQADLAILGSERDRALELGGGFLVAPQLEQAARAQQQALGLAFRFGRGLRARGSERSGLAHEHDLAGELLLEIDDAEQRIALARLKAQYPIAKLNAERYADLLKNDAASKLEAEAAFNAYKSIEAELKAAEFSVSQRRIVAPFAGVVGLTSIEPGSYIRAGDVATTIDDLSSLIIEFAVPQESAGDVKLGQKVAAVLAASQTARAAGVISAVDSRVDAASRTLKVEASFENADGALLPGATYAVSTTHEGAPALSAPGLAVQWDRAGAYVWKLGADGAVVRSAIRILQRRDQIVVAEGDIAAGDRVIVEGADRVRPGMRFPEAASADDGASSTG